ncbi:phosphoglycerate mutase-like protein [Xylariaceae sp. FL0804]|nr:phosphoglycerate mutase-like protein [Xylariaceae sp. FL0804]
MATFGRSALLASLGLFLASRAAADETVQASFAYIVHGERTPLHGGGPPSSSASTPSLLTPLGARQLHEQGAVFRARYLPSSHSPSHSHAHAHDHTSDEDDEDDKDDGGRTTTESAPIAGLPPGQGAERYALDNGLLDIGAGADAWTTASALAFMQGMYPPTNGAFAGGGGDGAAKLANGSVLEYPLGGYQYPSIQTFSATDPNVIWLAGHELCPERKHSIDTQVGVGPAADLYDSTHDFYRRTFAEVFPDSGLPPSVLSYRHAYDAYDYARFRYAHDAGARAALNPARLSILASLATDQQRDLHANLTVSGLKPGDRVRAVAGRTLAAKVVAQLSAGVAQQSRVSSSSGGSKLSLLFGSFEPLMAFFALAGLADGPESAEAGFRRIPDPGAAVVFELVGSGSGSTSDDDLWVRFLYRNGTGPDAGPLLEYPLFGRGKEGTRLAWSDFVNAVGEFSVANVGTWCRTCSATTAFCRAYHTSTSNSSSPGSRRPGLPPAVAGVIGGVVALAVLGLAVAAGVVLGGWRLQRRAAPKESPEASSSSGPSLFSRRGSRGGREWKLASDHDVSIARSGAAHARFGSWELGGGPLDVKGGQAVAFGAVVGQSQGGCVDGNDDRASLEGDAPVEPREAV